MKLNLRRPIAFFDIESTGVNVASDRIVELAVLKITPEGEEIMKVWRINPGMPIPLEASLVHNIYDADVAAEMLFEGHAPEILNFISDADLAGYNSNKFDIPLLLEELLRAGHELDMAERKLVDVQNIFHQMEQRTLKAAYRFYCQKDLVNAHSAEADIRATYEVLLAQLERYAEQDFTDKAGQVSRPVVNDIDALHNFTLTQKFVDFAGRMAYNNDGVEVINFGKHKGIPVEEVFSRDPSYYSWMMNGDFPLYTKKCLERLWAAHQAKRQQQFKGNRAPQQMGGQKPPSPPAGKYTAGVDNTRVVGDRPEVYSPGSQRKAEQEKKRPVTDEMLEQLKMKFGKPSE